MPQRQVVGAVTEGKQEFVMGRFQGHHGASSRGQHEQEWEGP